jgi:hypothetical protein
MGKQSKVLLCIVKWQECVMKKLGNTNTRMKSKALLIARIHTGRT